MRNRYRTRRGRCPTDTLGSVAVRGSSGGTTENRLRCAGSGPTHRGIGEAWLVGGRTAHSRRDRSAASGVAPGPSFYARCRAVGPRARFPVGFPPTAMPLASNGRPGRYASRAGRGERHRADRVTGSPGSQARPQHTATSVGPNAKVAPEQQKRRAEHEKGPVPTTRVRRAASASRVCAVLVRASTQRARRANRSGSRISTLLPSSRSQPRCAKSASALFTVSRDAPTY